MKNTLFLFAVAVFALTVMVGCEKEGMREGNSLSAENLVGEWDLTYGPSYTNGPEFAEEVRNNLPKGSRFEVLSFWGLYSEPLEYFETHELSLERQEFQEGENDEELARKYVSTHLKFDGQKVIATYTRPFVAYDDRNYKRQFYVLHSDDVTFDYTYDGTTLKSGNDELAFKYLSSKGIAYFTSRTDNRHFAMRSCSPKIKGGRGNLNEDNYDLILMSSSYYPGGLLGYLVLDRYTVKMGYSYRFQVQSKIATEYQKIASEYQWEDFPNLELRASSSDPESVSVSAINDGRNKDVKVEGLKAGVSADVKIELVTIGKKSTPVYRFTVKVTVEN